MRSPAVGVSLSPMPPPPSPKELEITCPCCEGRLWVDVRTQKVVRSRRPEELDEQGRPVVTASDWDDVHSRVAARTEGAPDRFDDALAREKSRARDLDALFEQAQERAQSPADDEPSEDG